MAKKQPEKKLNLQQTVDSAMEQVRNPKAEASKFLRKAKGYEAAGEIDKADASYLLFVRCARDCKSRRYSEGAALAMQMSKAAVDRGDEETADLYFQEIVRTFESAGMYDLALQSARGYARRNLEIADIANSRAKSYRKIAREVKSLKQADEKVQSELSSLKIRD